MSAPVMSVPGRLLLLLVPKPSWWRMHCLASVLLPRPMLPALTAECFGTRHFCANQSVPGAATALGALLLSNQLAGRVYKAHLPPAEPVCYGRFCFRCRPRSQAMLTLGPVDCRGLLLS